MRLSIFIMAATLFGGVATAQSVEWRGNRTGVYNNEKGLLKKWEQEGAKLLWHFDGLDEGHSSVAIAGDKIYVTGMSGNEGFIYVLDKTGKLLHKKGYGKEWAASYNGTRGTVTIDNGRLYVVSGMGEVYCFDANTLEGIWQKNLVKDFAAENITWGICESPLVVKDMVIVTPGGKDCSVVALNKFSGATVWKAASVGDLSAYCSPIYVEDVQVPQIITMMGKHIVGVDVKTGELLWNYEWINKYDVHANTPIYDKGMLLCTSGYGKGSVMLRLTSGARGVEKVWELADIDNRIGAMVKVGDYVYGSGDMNKFWFCVDWKTGTIKYKEKALPIGVTIAADGMLYCYSDRGDMALVPINPEKFEIVSRFPIEMGTAQHWAHPVINDGVMYVRHGNTLMAYAVK